MTGPPLPPFSETTAAEKGAQLKAHFPQAAYTSTLNNLSAPTPLPHSTGSNLGGVTPFSSQA